MKTEIAIIPEFTAEEYYNSSEPYKWLYQYKDDKFLMKQLLQKMKADGSIVPEGPRNRTKWHLVKNDKT